MEKYIIITKQVNDVLIFYDEFILAKDFEVFKYLCYYHKLEDSNYRVVLEMRDHLFKEIYNLN